jgi:SAM-dependent methyltransferase
LKEVTILHRNFIAKHWYAYVYEQYENQTNDVEFLLMVLKEQKADPESKILEVACGGGRICVPLAQAGYDVTGFDADEHMLLRCYRRMRQQKNLRCYQADAVTEDWGTGFDVIVLAGNILINIETETDYQQAQKLFIRKAFDALRAGGHLYLDFDLHSDPVPFFNSIRECSYFSGTDDMGTQGRTVSYGSTYDPVTQICAGTAHLELVTNAGEAIVIPQQWHKHIPTQAQVYGWLREDGFELERTYRDYSQEPITMPAQRYCRATLWARKA